MFFLNGKYTSTIVVDGVNKIISRIGDNRVFYDCTTRQIEQIGTDRVIYDVTQGCITHIGTLNVYYDAESNRISRIGTLPVIYDEQTGCIIQIGSATVYYAVAPDQYEPVQGSYYSPLKDIPAQEPHNIQPIGFSFESANRDRMAQFISELSNAGTQETALFRITLTLHEEQKGQDRFSDGYMSAAIEFGAIKQIALLLNASVPAKIRGNAQLALLALAKIPKTHSHHDHWMRQINAEAEPIINSMMDLMSMNPILEKQTSNALDLFATLSFSCAEIRTLVINKKIILFLVSQSNELISYPKCVEKINQILETIKPIHPAYLNAIRRAEVLGQNPSPFTVLLLSEYYKAHSFFSKQTHIFNSAQDDSSGLDTLLETLQKRAEKNPGGASAQTLNHFLK